MIITPVLIISCIIIAILLYLFLNAIDNNKKILNIVLAIIITPLVYFYIWYPISNIFIPYHHHKKFDAEAWEEKPGLRYEMIDNMIETNFLIGKSKNEVANILGKVQWLSWDFDVNNYNPNAWNYGLGLTPGAFTDQKEDVEIIFTNDKVSKVILSKSEYTYEPKKDPETNKVLDSINNQFKK